MCFRIPEIMRKTIPATMRQRTTPNTISQTGVEGSTGGDMVVVIFRNCSVLSLSRKALLILFRFILQEKKTRKTRKKITTIYKGVLQVKKTVENKIIFYECAAS